MNRDSIVPTCGMPGLRIIPSGLIGSLTKIARREVLSLLAKITQGRVTIVEGADRFNFGGDGPPRAVITVSDPAFYADVAFGGSIGAGESYMCGHWSTDDLTALIRIILLNGNVLLEMEGGTARFAALCHKVLHVLRKNTKRGSRRNIAAHYDIGNDFYSLWLDETMTYSCNVFEREDSTLGEAAIAKYDLICRKLALRPRDLVLEIGTGWGGFAIHAATQYGCRVTTTTISRNQYDWAKERVARAGLSDRIELLLEDYRDLKGMFDKVVSIEMIEAVGNHFFDHYFRTCSDRLKNDGVMALQAITMTDQVYRSHLRSPDFIIRYIFPGGVIPSISAITRSISDATDMKLIHLEDITHHYVKTLRLWRERFLARVAEIRQLGYPESFIRMWEFYLSYCEAGFSERHIGDVQMILVKPGSRLDDILPRPAQ